MYLNIDRGHKVARTADRAIALLGFARAAGVAGAYAPAELSKLIRGGAAPTIATIEAANAAARARWEAELAAGTGRADEYSAPVMFEVMWKEPDGSFEVAFGSGRTVAFCAVYHDGLHDDDGVVGIGVKEGESPDECRDSLAARWAALRLTFDEAGAWAA